MLADKQTDRQTDRQTDMQTLDNAHNSQAQGLNLWCAGARPCRVSCLGGLEPRAWRAREREPITGVWGLSPQWGPGAEPLAPLKLKTF